MTISSAFVSAESAAAVARAIVDANVADACAAGWARFTAGRWHDDFGGAIAREGRPIQVEPEESMVFDLASLTKPMTAIALHESGLPRVTPLQEVLSEAQGTPSSRVSLETLLAHRAGLEANLPLFQALRAGATTKDGALRAAAEARRPDCEGDVPAEGFPPVYSDLGYVLVGEAMARAIGLADAGEVIRKKLVEPLGLGRDLGTARALSQSGVPVERLAAPTEVVDWRGGVIRGAVHDENAWMLTGHGGSGHAGMFGTVRGVLSFARHVLERRDTFAWTWHPRAGGTLRAGFDGKSEEGSSAGTLIGGRAFGHLGFTGTSVWLDPDSSTVIVLLTNRVYPTRENIGIRAARPLAHDALVRIAQRALR